MINPGLAPRAMQECRPKGLLYVFPIDTLYCFDAVALPTSALKFRLTLSVTPLGIIVRLAVSADKVMP